MNEEYFQERATRLIQMLLKQRGIKQATLADLLLREGFHETASGVKGKLHRGTFSFAWVLACCKAMRVASLPVDWVIIKGDSPPGSDSRHEIERSR